MSRCETCVHNAVNDSDFSEYCKWCAEINPNVDELQYEQKITCNARVAILCFKYYNNNLYPCYFARFDISDSAKMFGRDKICSYTDHVTDSLIYCTCDEAKKYAIEHMEND